MPIAQKNHNCTLCHKNISKGHEYIYKTIRPWDHPDNDTFGVYKAHILCDILWTTEIGYKMDWIFPTDKYEWLEVIK